MSKLFKKLKAGLEDVLAHRQGKLDLRSELIDIPKPKMNKQRQLEVAFYASCTITDCQKV